MSEPANEDIPQNEENNEDRQPPRPEATKRSRPEGDKEDEDQEPPQYKRFKIITKDEEFKWSLPDEMASYVNDHSEKFIADKDIKESVLATLPRPDNLNPVKKLDEFLTELLKQKRKSQVLATEATLEKIQEKTTDVMGPLCKLWTILESVRLNPDQNIHIEDVLDLTEKSIVLMGQSSNFITYERRKNILLGVTDSTGPQVASMLKEKASHLQQHDSLLFGKEYTQHLSETLRVKKQSIEALREATKSTSSIGRNTQPFRTGPSHYNQQSSRAGGGQFGSKNSPGKNFNSRRNPKKGDANGRWGNTSNRFKFSRY